MITIVAGHSDPAIIDTLQDNHQTIHHDISLTDEEYHYTTIMYLFTALWSEVGTSINNLHFENHYH